MTKEVYILIKQIYDVWEILGVYSSKKGAEDRLEDERFEAETSDPGCWGEGGWDEKRDWSNGGKYIKVRNGDAIKNCYFIEKEVVI